MLISTSDLQVLEVINVVDGRRLGTVYDLELDVNSGRILRLILPGPPRGFLGWWGRGQDVEIPWENIVKIGVDVILVRMPQLVALDRDG